MSPFEGSAMLRPLFSTGMDASLGIESVVESKNEIVIYPNPAYDIINVRVPSPHSGTKKILLDSYGRVLKVTHSNGFDISALNAGIYFISVPALSSNYTKVIKP